MSTIDQAAASKGAQDRPEDSSLLQDVAQAVLARHASADWAVDPGEFWCRYTPAQGRMLEQGWKLHVAATQLSAPVVLARAAEVLIAAGCAFKFALSLSELRDLLAADCDRGSGGKFITAYPADDYEFRRLAAELDQVTMGLPGPVVLSDRRVRLGSLVSYRFGVFGAKPVLTNDGVFESVVTSPDGRHQKDERQAWFSPPPWATPPLPAPDAVVRPAADPSKPTPVLIADRFVVHEAIRQSYRGGVYRATDNESGAEVVLKQARPHVMSQLSGEDARDGLRHEASNLDMLADLDLTPRKVAVVTHQENVFLAEELVPGLPLRRWVDEHAGTWRGRGAPLNVAVPLARHLVELLASIHERGVVCRDFTPNNVMVQPDGQPRLVDLEHMVREGAWVPRAFTPAYGAPEYATSPRIGHAPGQSADLFSVGATILYMASGVDPLLPADEPAERPVHDRLGNLTALLGAWMPAVSRLAPLVLGLMQHNPERRWSLARALDFLARFEEQAPDPTPSNDRLAPQLADRLIADGLRHMLRTRQTESGRLWRATEYGQSNDPANVQHGAAGVLSVLTRAAEALGDDYLHEGVESVADWLRHRRLDIERLLPGLYFGRAGVAWSLYDAARLRGDEEMAEQAIDLAKLLPVEWPNPDVCHGAAGAGFTQLHLWLASGDNELKDRGIQALDCVLAAERDRDGEAIWPIPADFDSNLAGLVHYGFAHGVAGAGAFLLYGALMTGRAEYLDAARRAGDTLLGVADIETDDDGALAWWPSGRRLQGRGLGCATGAAGRPASAPS